jgi:hypothetical protein
MHAQILRDDISPPLMFKKRLCAIATTSRVHYISMYVFSPSFFLHSNKAKLTSSERAAVAAALFLVLRRRCRRWLPPLPE